jgi:adenylosuccinate lyase
MNKKKLNFDTYLSPFTWRYGSEEMREIWSEKNKRKVWRKIWVELARAQHKIGLVTKEELKDIEVNKNNIDIERAHEIEKEIYHDLMAEIKTYAEQAKKGGGKIHLGATSMDIVDNADLLLCKESLKLIKKKLIKLIKSFEKQIEKYKNTPCMGYTHLQPAEPTTIGYRLSFYAQDLLWDLEFIEKIENFVKGKGIKGAVGTSASYEALLKETTTNSFEFEKEIMESLNLEAVDISGQTYPRKIDLLIIESLINIASSLHKFNFDLRIMQSPNFGEWSEPRSKKRIGSSAMPFKKNPDKAEKICSLCKFTSSLFQVAWSNPAMSLLERTLDDSAAKRVFMPEAFLTIDECIKETDSIVDNLVVFDNIVKTNLKKYGIFSSTENLLMELSKKGANRQEMHEVIRENSMLAWENISNGKENNLVELLKKDKRVLKFINALEIPKYFDPEKHTGVAKKRAERFLKKLKKIN